MSNPDEAIDSETEKSTTLYLCDTTKNTKCPGNGMPWCGKRDFGFVCNCYLTTKKKFALLDENGNPMIDDEEE